MMVRRSLILPLFLSIFCLWSHSVVVTATTTTSEAEEESTSSDGSDSVPQQAQNNTTKSSEECSPEFEPCYFQNCCEGLICYTNHNSMYYSHDRKRKKSTCLSERSTKLEAKTDEEKFEMIRNFYEEIMPSEGKSTEQITRMVQKHLHSFPHLVSRLEKRYQISIPMDNINNADEL